MMCFRLLAVGLEAGVTALPVWIATKPAAIAANTARMVTPRLMEIIDARMDQS
jgi:hypothetical protein